MRSIPFIMSILVALSIAQVSYANDSVLVIAPAILEANAPIAVTVKAECAVETSVGKQIFQQVQERIPGTEQTANPNLVEPNKRVLKVSILSVRGVGGGGWSGSKSIAIRADVLQNAQVIESKTLSRNSRGGVFGGMSGTCAIMDRIAAALGRDVADWLSSELNAKQVVAPAGQPASKEGLDSSVGRDANP